MIQKLKMDKKKQMLLNYSQTNKVYLIILYAQ